MDEIVDNKIPYESPEQYFLKRKEYIEHYYKQESDVRSIRLECLKMAAGLVPNGTSSDKLIEYSNKFYNWIINYGKESKEGTSRA